MAKSLLEQLAKIVADAKTEAGRIPESLEDRHRERHQTQRLAGNR